MFAARDRSTTRLHRRCAKRVGAADATAWSAVVAPQGRRQLRSTARSGRRAYSRREIASSAAFFVRAAEQQWPRLVHWGARPPFSPPANGRAFLAPRQTSRRGVFFAAHQSARCAGRAINAVGPALWRRRGAFLTLAPHAVSLAPVRRASILGASLRAVIANCCKRRGQPRVRFPRRGTFSFAAFY